MPVLGMRHTGNLESLERPKAWRQGIYDEYPDAAPLVHLIYRTGKERASDPEFNWYERRTPTRELTLAAAVAGGSPTATITVGTDEAYNCVKGSMLFHEPTGQTVIVTADPTTGNQLAIKTIDGSNLQAWASGSKVQVFSNAHPEGGDVGAAISIQPVKYTNYCQIFRNVADISRTLSKTTLRTGDKRKDAQKTALLLHEMDKEGAFLWGVKYEDLTAVPGPRRTTEGIITKILTDTTGQANIVDFSSTGLTMNGWNNFLAQVFTNGSDEKILYAGRQLMLVLEQMVRAYSIQLYDVNKQDTFGMELSKWKTSFGTLYIKEHKLFSRNAKYKSAGLILDPETVVYRYVDDTEWYPNRQNPGSDRFIGEYLAEVGIEFREIYKSGLILNANTYGG